jgi:hypothetical protein
LLNRSNLETYWSQSADLAIETNQLESALPVLDKMLTSAHLQPQTQLAALRLILAFASSPQSTSSENWLQRAAQLIQRIEREQGQYWSRVAERTLVDATGRAPDRKTADSTPPGMNKSLEIVSRMGDVAFRESRWADAQAAYGNATQQAIDSQQWQAAFELQFKLAQALEKTKQLDDAIRGLLSLAQKQPQHPYASTAHLRATWYVAQQAATSEQARARFRDLLVEHLRDWPGTESSHQARLWLARLQMASQEFSLAVENYLQIPAAATQSIEAAKDLRLAVSRLLQSLASDPVAARTTAERISRTIVSLLSLDESDAAPSITDVYLLQTLAPVVAEFQSLPPLEMAQQLEKSLQIKDPENNNWQTRQRSLILAFIADAPDRQGRANEHWEAIQDDPLALETLASLLNQRNQNSGELPLQDWQLKTAARLELLATNPADKVRWQLQQGQILFQNGQHAEATRLLKPIADANSQWGEVQLLLARALTSQATEQTAALAQWRKVANDAQSHTEIWYEAKYEVARLLIEAGQVDEASKLLRYIQTIPPGWNSSSLKTKFESLLERCRDQ